MALVQPAVELILAQYFKHLVHVPEMVFRSFAVNQQIVQVDQHKAANVWGKDAIHDRLKMGGSIGEPEQQHLELKQPHRGAESRFVTIFLHKGDLAVPLHQINRTENSSAPQLIQQIVNAGQRILISLRDPIQGPVIHTHAEGAIGLPYKQNRSSVRAGTPINQFAVH